jgi:hypothetical protein
MHFFPKLLQLECASLLEAMTEQELTRRLQEQAGREEHHLCAPAKKIKHVDESSP